MSFEKHNSFASAERIPTGMEIIQNSYRARQALEQDAAVASEIENGSHVDDESIHKEIYSEYLAVETKKHNSKWLSRLRAALFKKPDPTAIAESLAYEHALRENLDFDAQMQSEATEWQANLELVKDEMQRYKEGDRTVRPIVIVLGGAMKGVHCAAQLQALEELGYRDSFAAIGGISAGSGPAAFFAAGETRKAIKLFIEECTTTKFLNLTAKNLLPQNWKHILNLDVIKDFMETPGEKGLNTEALMNSDTELFTLATNTAGGVDILDMKKATHKGILNMVAACVASACIPLFKPKGHEVNGQIYFDGSVGDMPLDKIIEKYGATSVLILSNHSLYDQDTYEQTSLDYIIQTIGTKLGKEGSLGSASSLGTTLVMRDNKTVVGTLANYITKKAQSRQTLKEYAVHKNVKIGVHFSPPSSVGNLTTSPEAFAAAMSDSYRDTMKKFSAATAAA